LIEEQNKKNSEAKKDSEPPPQKTEDNDKVCYVGVMIVLA